VPLVSYKAVERSFQIPRVNSLNAQELPKYPLSKFMPPGVFIGVSLILPVSGRYLFGIRPPKRHENQTILELTGIGGGIEPPKPCGELPWLLCITERQILETARRDIPLAQLLENEAVLITGKALPPQMNALVRLTDSQEALALALGEGLIRFYKSANYLDGLANYGGV